MAEEERQPDRDEMTPSVPGTEPPVPAAPSGVPSANSGNRVVAPAPTPREDDAIEKLFAQAPRADDLFPSGAPAPTGASVRLSPKPRQLLSRVRTLWHTLCRLWRQLSLLQRALVAGILVIAVAVLYVLLTGVSGPVSAEGATVVETPAEEATPPQRARKSPPVRAPVEAVEAEASPGTKTRDGEGLPSARSRVEEPEPQPGREATRMAAQARIAEPPREELPLGTRALPGPEPLSLQLADKLYRRHDFEPALSMYDKLYRHLPTAEENQPLRDFLVLRMALCQKNSGHATQADSLFRTVSLSRLPILRALARYHQGTMLLSRKRYLEAQTKAYQTTALIEVASYDKKWVSLVQQQCGFAVAEAMTRHLLSLCDADANLPKELWSVHPDIDPFAEMEEPQLRALLACGVEPLEVAVLSPQIHNADEKSSTSHWSVVCNGAPIEELLTRFAANAGVNIRWTGNAEKGPVPSSQGGKGDSPLDDNVRGRPVYLYLTSATAPQVVTTAAGSVGLIAQTDDKGGLRLQDPTSYSSLADHTNLLAEEAIALWQRFLLLAESDPRATNAHFALALVQAARGQFDQASAEYKLVANRYAKHPLAPHALLQSGLLKIRLRDYAGAHADLKQLVELYPESELSDRACLCLAEATMKAGLYQEATGLYRKVYNLGLSAASQAQAALGAGRCLYETKQYEEAAKWLAQYTVLAPDQSRPDFSAACLLLGKAYLALHQPQQAQAALHLAIKGDLSHQQHVETIVALVRTCLEQGLYVQALDTLETTGGWQLSQQEGIELVLLRAQAFRALGLADKAATLLEAKVQYLPSPALQARVALELAQCHIETGHLEAACKILGQAFAAVEPGPLAAQLGRELAGVCVRLGQTAQAISVCSQLLEHASAAERPSILALLTEAYRKEGKYDQAVATLLDRYQAPEPIKEN